MKDSKALSYAPRALNQAERYVKPVDSAVRFRYHKARRIVEGTTDAKIAKKAYSEEVP